MRYFLCGQTGNINRGCEAIIRSTVKILQNNNEDIYVATYAPDLDRPMVRELGITIIPYANYPSQIHRYISIIIRKINKKSYFGFQYIHAPLMKLVNTNDVCLTIGGDTYWYGRPISNMAFNKFTTLNRIDNILWCCSIEKDNITNEVLEDLKRYKYIFAREKITYDNLLKAGIDESKIIKCCDPAFFLNHRKTLLPVGFIEENTVGINLSEMVINESNPNAWKNVCKLIEYILKRTDMSICLIPHVYSISQNSNDYPILKKLKDQFNDSRISIIDKEYNCEQLKYIISRCRFFVGARTHATIAAYSSEIPTLVLGYSIKSKGIASDLFGTYEGYVLPYHELIEENTLTNAFVNIMTNENEIKLKLHTFLPKYRKTLEDAIERIFKKKKLTEKFNICDYDQCTGCGACSVICPKQCISMKKNDEGFLYPVIDYHKCIHCGNCQRKCPVKNKYKEDNKEPETYACMNKDDHIRMMSSSGGIFTLLAEKIIKDGGFVYGAAFDQNFVLKHKMIKNIKEIEKLRGSKYVQSDINDTYQSIKNNLLDGKKVLFSGTPCQIGGLYAVLGKNYDNLITVDLACHGVASPKVWEEYVKYREKKSGKYITNISFRDKRSGWKKYSVTFKFSDGTEYSKPLTEDLYMRGFLSHIFFRKSCTNCSFKNIHRQSDLTLADYWGIEKDYPKKNDNKGVSLVMIHSEKGKQIFSELYNSMDVFLVDYKNSIIENKSLLQSIKINNLSQKFYKDLKKLPFNTLIEKYCGNKITSKFRRKIAQMRQ